MEERLNAITHGVGAVLALTGLVVLAVASSLHGTVWHVVSFSIFGASLLLLYVCSTLYHSFGHGRAKAVFRRLDHAAIYLLIAGTYTPFTLVALHGPVGWVVFGIIWALAAIGIALEQICSERVEILVTSFFLMMGWLSLFAVRPLIAALPAPAIAWLVVGGVLYSVGAVIYLMEKMPYNHAVWHLFVVAGSAAHFIAVFLYVLPIPVA
jgi:hemolysin III